MYINLSINLLSELYDQFTASNFFKYRDQSEHNLQPTVGKLGAHLFLTIYFELILIQ